MDISSVPLDAIGYLIVGAGLIAKGTLDGWAKTRVPSGAACNCNFDADARSALMELHRLHYGPGATDPRDGLPRWYCRDLARDMLEQLRSMEKNCNKCSALYESARKAERDHG